MIDLRYALPPKHSAWHPWRLQSQIEVTYLALKLLILGLLLGLILLNLLRSLTSSVLQLLYSVYIVRSYVIVRYHIIDPE